MCAAVIFNSQFLIISLYVFRERRRCEFTMKRKWWLLCGLFELTNKYDDYYNVLLLYGSKTGKYYYNKLNAIAAAVLTSCFSILMQIAEVRKTKVEQILQNVIRIMRIILSTFVHSSIWFDLDLADIWFLLIYFKFQIAYVNISFNVTLFFLYL